MTATPISGTQINLAWDPTSGATSYNVQRFGSFIATSATANYSNTGLTVGATYTYSVSALTNGVEGTRSALVSATTLTTALTITTVSPLPGGTTGSPYSTTLTAAGGIPPYTWSLISGTLTGLTLSPAGVISGTTPAAQNDTLVIQVQDSTLVNTQGTFNLTITTSATAPAAPTGVTATVASSTSATVSYTAAVNNGSPITNYVVTSSPGALTASGNLTSLTVTGLTTGTAYTFTVKATNAIGTGPASAASNSVTPASVPGAPTGVTASAGVQQAAITFSAPASNGGSAITSYTATASPGGTAANGATSPITVTGLTAGTTYTFTATATNAVGTGPASTASNSVVPQSATGAPTAPSNVLLTNQGGSNPVNGGGSNPGSNQQSIAWTASSPGSFPIANYKIYRNGVALASTANATTLTYTDSTATNSNDALPGSLADGVSFRGPKTPYMYTVSAVDTQGTEGPRNTDLTYVQYKNGRDGFGGTNFKQMGAGAITLNSTDIAHAGSTSVIKLQSIWDGTPGDNYIQTQPSASGPDTPIYSFEVGAFAALNDGYLQFDIYPTKTGQVFVLGYVSRVYIPSLGRTDDFYNYAGAMIGTASTGTPYNVNGGDQNLSGTPYGPVPMVQNAWNHYKVRLRDIGVGMSTFQGYISGSTLTVTTPCPDGMQIVATAWIYRSGMTTDYITGAGPSVNTGTTGRGYAGTYSMNVSQTVGSAGAPVTFTIQRTNMYKWSLGDVVYGASANNLFYMDNIKWTTS